MALYCHLLHAAVQDICSGQALPQHSGGDFNNRNLRISASVSIKTARKVYNASDKQTISVSFLTSHKYYGGEENETGVISPAMKREKKSLSRNIFTLTLDVFCFFLLGGE